MNTTLSWPHFVYRERTDAEWIALKNHALANSFTPGAIVEMHPSYSGIFQLVSFPFFGEGVGKIAVIMARLTPGDPASMREIPYDCLNKTIHFEDL